MVWVNIIENCLWMASAMKIEGEGEGTDLFITVHTAKDPREKLVDSQSKIGQLMNISCREFTGIHL